MSSLMRDNFQKTSHLRGLEPQQRSGKPGATPSLAPSGAAPPRVDSVPDDPVVAPPSQDPERRSDPLSREPEPAPEHIDPDRVPVPGLNDDARDAIDLGPVPADYEFDPVPSTSSL